MEKKVYVAVNVENMGVVISSYPEGTTAEHIKKLSIDNTWFCDHVIVDGDLKLHVSAITNRFPAPVETMMKVKDFANKESSLSMILDTFYDIKLRAGMYSKVELKRKSLATKLLKEFDSGDIHSLVIDDVYYIDSFDLSATSRFVEHDPVKGVSKGGCTLAIIESVERHNEILIRAINKLRTGDSGCTIIRGGYDYDGDIIHAPNKKKYFYHAKMGVEEIGSTPDCKGVKIS